MIQDLPSDATPPAPAWISVDEGWGRRAADFATLSEPGNCREYVALHQQLGVGAGDRLLDLACGAGLALELAAIRGASCAGIDASPRLLRVARDRSPDADLRLGDMNALPWEAASFDVVTSFRGIWGTTPDAVAEAHRVLAPGGRIGLTVWGHLKRSPGAWALDPFRLATPPKIAHQAAMVALGRPGVGEALLARCGFTDVERIEIPFVWEFADPATYARALASTGPAFEAIQDVGEEAFRRHAVELAEQRLRDGLPLRAPIAAVGFVARRPATVRPRPGHRPEHRPGPPRPAGPGTSDGGFLPVPPTTPDVQRLYDEDVADGGHVMNSSARVWAHLPAAQDDLFSLLGRVTRTAELSVRQRGVLVTACASTLGDSYCALAWGTKLAVLAGADLAADVLTGTDDLLDDDERALARWARHVVRDPNGTTPADVRALRDAGYDDAQIVAITLYVSLRLALSTVNDALGARPDRALAERAPDPVRAAVTYGRPPATD